MTEQEQRVICLRAALVAWLRWYATSEQDCDRVPAEAQPLLRALFDVNQSQYIARLADEIEVERHG